MNSECLPRSQAFLSFISKKISYLSEREPGIGVELNFDLHMDSTQQNTAYCNTQLIISNLNAAWISKSK